MWITFVEIMLIKCGAYHLTMMTNEITFVTSFYNNKCVKMLKSQY